MPLSALDPYVEVACEVESPLEVEAGENISIRCKATPGSLYMWTKVTWRTHPPCPAHSLKLPCSAAILTSEYTNKTT